MLASAPLSAGTKLEPKAVEANPKAVAFEPKANPWAFSAGAIVRSIEADFHLAPPAPLLHSGRGEVGFFGAADDRVNYDNGFLRKAYGFPLEAQSSAIVYGGSARRTARRAGFIDVVTEFEFYTHSYSFDSREAAVSDRDVGVGPYLELSRRVVDCRCLVVDAFIGWSLVATEHSTGDQTLATLEDTLHTYRYEGATWASRGQPPVFPGSQGFVIFSKAAFFNTFGGTGFNDPTHTDRVLAVYYATTRADLDVRLNEIPLGLKVGRRFGCLTVLAELGGTLNVIHYDLDASTTWQRSTGQVVSRARWSDSGSPVKVGFFTGLAVQCNLTKSGRIFMEAHGTYRWVDSIRVAAGPVSTVIDISSWEGGLSIGCRL
jgi:hypothetical protein